MPISVGPPHINVINRITIGLQTRVSLGYSKRGLMLKSSHKTEYSETRFFVTCFNKNSHFHKISSPTAEQKVRGQCR